MVDVEDLGQLLDRRALGGVLLPVVDIGEAGLAGPAPVPVQDHAHMARSVAGGLLDEPLVVEAVHEVGSASAQASAEAHVLARYADPAPRGTLEGMQRTA